VTEKFDDSDWHEDALSDEADPIGAFTHIGLYLEWIVRHGLHRLGLLEPGDVEDILSGAMSAVDLANLVDGKLVSDLLSQEGYGFTAWYYWTYLSDLDGLFDGPYRISFDDTSYGLIREVIDRRYAEWIDADRPPPELRTEQPRTRKVPEPASPARASPDFLAAERRAFLELGHQETIYDDEVGSE
jgi:hypothetical protein